MKRVFDVIFDDNTKRCDICKKIKPTSDFNKNSSRNCGFSWACRECNSVRQRIHRQKDSYKIKSKIRKKLYRMINFEESWVDSTIARHKAKGYIINIHRKELIELAKKSKKCKMCGIELDWSTNKGKMKTYSPTLDRVNNEQELNINNVQIICNRCNKAKGTMKYNEFIDYCRKIGKLKKEGE